MTFKTTIIVAESREFPQFDLRREFGLDWTMSFFSIVAYNNSCIWDLVITSIPSTRTWSINDSFYYIKVLKWWGRDLGLHKAGLQCVRDLALLDKTLALYWLIFILSYGVALYLNPLLLDTIADCSGTMSSSKGWGIGITWL